MTAVDVRLVDTVVFRRADDVPDGVWRDTSEHLSVYAGRSWARASSRSGKYDTLYVEAVDAASGKGVGILPLYSPVGRGNPNYGPDALLGPLAARLDESQRRWTYVGTHGGFLTELPLAPELTQAERARVLETLFRSPEIDAARHAGALCMAYAPREQAVAAAEALGRPASVVFTGGDCSVPVRFATFADYLEQLGSHRRSIVVRDLRRFEASGLELRTTTLADVDAETIARLLAALEQKYGNGMTAEAALAFVERHADVFGDDGLAFLALREGDVVGCAVFYVHGRRLYGRFCGFDYGRTAGAAAYARLVCSAPLQHALDHGFEEVHLGTGSYHSKLLRGARLRELWSVVGWNELDAPGESLHEDLEAYSQARRDEFLRTWEGIERR